MTDKIRAASPAVLEFAEAHGIDLNEVKASGADGRILLADVEAKAASNQRIHSAVCASLGVPDETPVKEVLARLDQRLADAKRAVGLPVTASVDEMVAARKSRAAASAAVSRAPRTVAASRGPAFALNPLVDQVRVKASAGHVRTPTAPIPSLFASGATPAFCASGIPPESLLDVPWQARHAMAAAPTAADAYAIVAECSGPDGEQTAEMVYGAHPGNADYAYRVQQWRVAAMSDAELYRSVEPAAREELARREAALPLELPDNEGAAIDAALGGFGLGERSS